MKKILKPGISAGLFLAVLLSAISLGFGGELIEPTRTLHDAQKTWGGLAIFSEPPQQEVYLNGEKVGRTPLWLRQVDIGPHTIKIADAETTVQIGKDEKVTVGLFKGSLIIGSEQKKPQHTAEKRMERPTAAPYSGLPEEEERRRDLTNWERFINGTLKHF